MTMQRRDFLKTATLAAASTAWTTGTKGTDTEMNTNLPDPTGTTQRLTVKQLKTWQDLQYGMFICFGMITFDRESFHGGDGPCTAYQPTRLDVEQNLLLSVPPDNDGLIPEKWTAALMELKKKMGL